MTASHSETPSNKPDASTFISDHLQVDRSKLSQMYLHYVETKDKYPHAVLLYRVGDFFECYFQDAVKLAQELELVLTSKQAGEQGRVAMSGVPHHAWERYATMLVEKGYAVVICDQVEDASEAAGRLVRREVTRILTPGTLLEEGMLKSSRNNYLAAVVIAANHWGLAYADISTGEFLTTQGSDLEHLTQELMRLQPSEVLVPTNAPDLGSLLRPGETSPHLPECLPPSFCYSLRSQLPFSQGEARPRLLQKFKVRSLEGLGCDHLPLAVRAAGGLLEYLEDTQKENPVTLQRLRSYTVTDYLIVDNQTRRNLEITQTVRDGTFHGSLLWALDKTSTAMGGRALRRWLLQPLLDIKGIRARQDTIQELMENTPLRQDLRHLLRQIYDLERLTGRAGSGTANARDLVALADSLSRLPELSNLVVETRSPFLKALQKVPSVLEELAQKLHAHLVESPPILIKEGGLIRPSVNPLLDERKATVEADQQWIANLEVDERAKTGISTLKVGFNKTFGYYISISRSKADQVPANYIRKQTLTNEERYITPDLKEREARILTARDDLNQLEYEIFTALREEVAQEAEVIRNLSRAVAAADVLCGLAELAVHQGYCRPEMLPGREVNIVDGRHPVVEQSLPAGFFVPNSTQLGSEETNRRGAEDAEEKEESFPAPDLIILTGPNASGKSCYLRQVGLIQLMAQIGSFVPARFARLGICDRIFTRVGAVDDLATGQSTFMVEMNETANILNHATSRSLVLLDEIGRGTATFDGLSIAWAVAEYIAVDIRSRTIFATHYHELNELASIIPNVANYQVTVKELPDQIIFLHQVQPGGADKSYGIEAGRLAGLPAVVIQRAKQVMGQIEKHSKIAMGLQNLDG
ncbi:DNA mismatch repair protein MutS [Nostoc sp. 'Peltigera malacea cyanobiont' DB3992]|uniref:DNA mismatch repair protein MutS n=1 Tax=Nostoc sp. 'Peltigera malacea cyanobiont' DB3992 TaxID=1206980 RepID=UPI000C0398A4|nr:DNA mismatch repair protein MutS [Nostoc sp. 'Peltigera malacea cyanobiont' DB3992]PHM08429.1 DNA mismatch repair protein MutS [Nostoc sp. 'Peltigera malacea cyanobiont' DB3992]